MTVLLKDIEIENFRSIRRLSVNLNYLSTLVGTNDSGKSNVLRALNLFFNSETSRSRPLNFSIDHNVHNRPNRRAKEISIKVRLGLPDAYVATNGNEIVWEKKWRGNNISHDSYHGIRVTRNKRGLEVRNQIEIPPKSNVHSLLRKIDFIYIPAVRDSSYFDFLRGQIHKVIAEVADAKFRDSSADFERSIAVHLSGLTDDIRKELNINSRLALPQDLSHVFERLDFLAESTEISLDSRGDGIKARHIPLILKFMADQKRSMQTRGAAPITTIWGYEEPENNLEFRNALSLADELWNFMMEGVAQIILTSHSPVFYNLVHKNTQDESFVKCIHVFKEGDEEGTRVSDRLEDLDERLGTTAVLAPKLLELEKSIRDEEAAKAAAALMAISGRAKIFVEGTSDRDFVLKLFREFAPGFLGTEADIETLDSGAGHNYVGDMLKAWYHVRKHDTDRPRAVGILDADEPGASLMKEWNYVPTHIESCKCFVWKKPERIQRAHSRGFKIPITLEELYPIEVWEQADERGELEDRVLSSILPKDVLEKVIKNESSIEEMIQNEFKLYVKKKFKQSGKATACNRVAHWHSDKFKNEFCYLEPLVNSIVSYLVK